jgi:hypothetical protein
MMADTPARAPGPRGDALHRAAAANVALHVAGLVLAAMALRPGTPAAPLPARMGYLAARPLGWTLGWLVWVLCAAALVTFMILLARAVPSRATRAGAALTLVAAVIDSVCDVTYAWLLPARAAASLAAFVSLESRLGLLSLTLANGLYSAAVLISTLALPRTAVLARSLGFVTFLGGTGLAAAGLTGTPWQVALGTAITIPSFMAWTLAVSGRRQ